MSRVIKLGLREIGENNPAYFIADISANHDGNIERARKLIRLAAESGADAAKFQNFRAQEIVSREGFLSLGKQISHQKSWNKSVFEVYKDASIPWDWTPVLKEECESTGIDYLSTPYDLAAVDMLDKYVSLFKIGSGDIDWKEMLVYVASKGKPVIIATGASDIGEVQRAILEVSRINSSIILMQCNTNYTGNRENFRFINLNVLKTYRQMYPSFILGLSDHTPGHSAVLGAVALGARVIEKHFTDDTHRLGPDHPFSMTPSSWREMIERTRELESALGEYCKRIQKNEQETVVIQRRCIRSAMNLPKGSLLSRDKLAVLRPAPEGSLSPYEMENIIGMRLRKHLSAGEFLTWSMLEPNE
jgi:N-acetylneuraminate synthase